jgi:hypothetical protein
MSGKYKVVWLNDGNVGIYEFDDVKKVEKFIKHIEDNGNGFHQMFNGNITEYGLDETEDEAYNWFGIDWDARDEEDEEEK